MYVSPQVERDVNTDEGMMSIGEVAKIFDISQNTLRLYERSGLIITKRTSINRRLYNQHDIKWIKKIRSLITEERMNIEGIRRLLVLYPCWAMTNCGKQNSCSAYSETKLICFEATNKDRSKCRECDVYKAFILCDRMKNFLRAFKH